MSASVQSFGMPISSKRVSRVLSLVEELGLDAQELRALRTELDAREGAEIDHDARKTLEDRELASMLKRRIDAARGERRLNPMAAGMKIARQGLRRRRGEARSGSERNGQELPSISCKHYLGTALGEALEVQTMGTGETLLSNFANGYHSQGKVEAIQDSLFAVARARGILLTEEDRQRVLACTELAKIETWFSLALHATTGKGIFTRPIREHKYISDFAIKHHSQGKADGIRESIFAVTRSRRILLTEEDRQRVSACTDLQQLETWFSLALHATTVTEVFDDGPPGDHEPSHEARRA
jgi:hypothetical protein